MTDAAHGDAESLFQAALDRPKRQRAAFLDEHAPPGSPLRIEVDELLAHFDFAGEGFLRQPVSAGLAPIDELAPGLLLCERYRLVRVIGEGGLGVVWEAEQVRPMHRRVAIKVIRAGMDTAQVLDRFEREREALARMSHPGIAAVFDAGATPRGRPFVAMELVQGSPIGAHCDGATLDVEARVRLMIDVCDAVQHAHRRGVIHRDLKPSNILVVHGSPDSEPDGNSDGGTPSVKVIDFGIAKATRGEGGELDRMATITEQGQIIGTPAYMSPEQAEGGRAASDSSVDIYSLGVVLYELLCGALPWAHDELLGRGPVELARLLRDGSPARPSTRLRLLGAQANEIARRRRSDLPTLHRRLRGEFDWIAMKAMAPRPEDRYASAAEFAADLRRALNGEAVLAGAPSVWHRCRRFARRHRGPAIAASLVFGAILLGLAGTTWGLFDAWRAEARTRHVAYRASVTAAAEALASGAGESIRRSLDDAPAALRQWEWRYLRYAGDGAIVLSGHVGGVSSCAFLPDDGVEGTRRVMTAGDDGTLIEWIVDRNTGIATLVRRDSIGSELAAGGARNYRWLALSRDGSIVLAGSFDGPTCAWSRAERRLLWSVPLGSLVRPGAISPEGAHAVVGARDGTLRILDMRDGRVLFERRLCASPVLATFASPTSDGANDVLWASSDERIGGIVALQANASSLSIADRHAWNVPLGHTSRYGGFDRTRQRVIGLGGGSADVIDARTGSILATIPVPRAGAEASAALSPDGIHAALPEARGAVLLWDLASHAPAARLVGHAGDVLEAAFSADGIDVVTASEDGTARVWLGAIARGTAVARAPDQWRPACGATSANGQTVLTAGWGFVRAWDGDTGMPRWLLNVRGTMLSVATCPDGEWLAATDSNEVLVVARGGTARAPSVAEWSAAWQRGARDVRWAGGDLWLVDGTGRLAQIRRADGSIVHDLSPPQPIARLLAADENWRVAVTDDVPPRVVAERDGAWHALADAAPAARPTAAALILDATACIGYDSGAVALVSLDGRSIEWAARVSTSPIVALTAHPTEARIAVAARDGEIHVVDTARGEILAHVSEDGTLAHGTPDPILALGFADDGERLLASRVATPVMAFETSNRPSLATRAAVRQVRPAVQALFAAERLTSDVLARLESGAAVVEGAGPFSREWRRDPALVECARSYVDGCDDFIAGLGSDVLIIARDRHATTETIALARRLIDRVVAMVPDEPAYVVMASLVSYREGLDDAALDGLRAAAELRLERGLRPTAVAHLVASLVFSRGGLRDDAQRALDAATAQARADGSLASDTYRMLAAEAEAEASTAEHR